MAKALLEMSRSAKRLLLETYFSPARQPTMRLWQTFYDDKTLN